MSSQVFAELTLNQPALKHAALELDAWVDNHPATNEFLVSWVAKDLSDRLSALEMAKVVACIDGSAKLDIVFRVLDPEGNIVGKAYRKFDDIPKVMEDLSGDFFDVKFSSIVQMIKIQ